MDEDTDTKSKVKTEVKDGYVQLTEKMEQVRSQMANMERKYDELYQSVKEKEPSRNPSVSADQTSPEASKTQRESVSDSAKPKGSDSESSPSTPKKPSEEEIKPKGEMDLEKLEDNPFL